VNDHWAAVIGEIERQATHAWGSPTPAIAAYDYFTINIPAYEPGSAPFAPSSEQMSTSPYSSGAATPITASAASGIQTPLELHHADPAEGLLYARRNYNDRNKKRRFHG
jgi:hypothetical protein